MVIIQKLVPFFVFSAGLLKLAAKFECLTQIPMCGPKVRVQLYGFSKLSDRFGITSRDDGHVSPIGVDDHGKRVKINRAPQLSDGTIEFAQREKKGVAKIIENESVIEI
jgi:hypothetical protein